MRVCVIGLVIGFCSTFHASAEDAPRSPVPAQVAVAAATQTIVQSYQKDIDAAKSQSAQRAIAARLFDDATRTKEDHAARFVMFNYCRSLATKSGDLKLALATIDQQSQTFEIDRSQGRLEVFQAFAAITKSTPERLVLVRLLTLNGLELKKAGRFDLALQSADLALALSKKLNDPDLIKQWNREINQLKAQSVANVVGSQAIVALEAQPSDAAANQAAGEYLCYWKQQWEKGLPMLALGNNPAIQKLAEQEIREQASTADQLALADAWYDLGKSQTDQARVAILAHAGKHYERLLPNQGVLAKKWIENRMDEISLAVRPIAKNEWIEVLDLIDPNVQTGPWQRDMVDVRVKNKGMSRIALPIVLTGSYEVQIRATRHTGPGQYYLKLSRAGRGRDFLLNGREGRVSGIDYVNGKGPHDNATSKPPIKLPNGTMYVMDLQLDVNNEQCELKVRVNDKPYIAWKGLASDLGEPVRADGMLLGTWRTEFVLHSIRLKVKGDDSWFTD